MQLIGEANFSINSMHIILNHIKEDYIKVHYIIEEIQLCMYINIWDELAM